MTQHRQAESEKESLAGLVERVTFHSPETGFCVLRVKIRGNRDLVTLVGSAASIQPGEYVHASGRWDNHRDHGLQFKADFLKVTPPTTTEGIERYLGSGMIKGIGPVYAKKLVDAFREAVFRQVEGDRRDRSCPGDKDRSRLGRSESHPGNNAFPSVSWGRHGAGGPDL